MCRFFVGWIKARSAVSAIARWIRPAAFIHPTHTRHGAGKPGACGGFTYIGVLFLIAFMGVALAAAGAVWSQTRQREKEQELLFAGNQLRQAIISYYDATPGAVKQFPKKLEDLLLDNRYPDVRRHLRRIFRDPMTGGAEWGLVKGADNAIVGVYSLSDDAPLKTSNFDAPDSAFEDKRHYSEWRFVSPRGAAAAGSSPSASAAESPGGVAQADQTPGEPQADTAAAPPPAAAPKPPGAMPAEEQHRAQCDAALLRARTLCFSSVQRNGAASAAECFQSASAQYTACIK